MPNFTAGKRFCKRLISEDRCQAGQKHHVGCALRHKHGSV